MTFNAIVQNDRELPGSFDYGLSKAAKSAWAKHDRSTEEWLPLWRHLADAGAVAGLLWDRWLPPQIKQVVVQSLPGGLEDGRRLAVWLAATHDIGKATPAFACQVESLADAMRSAGLDMPLHSQMTDRKLAPHGLAGQVLLGDWLVDRFGWKRSATHQFTVIAGGHHGVPPSHENIQDLDAHPHLLRTSTCAALWQQVQWEILDRCAEACGVADRLPEWAAVKLSQPAQVLLTGLVIVADWIASDADLFPYSPEAWGRSEQERVEGAWCELGLPSPWRAREFTGEPEQLIFSRHRLPDGARVRPRAISMSPIWGVRSPASESVAVT